MFIFIQESWINLSYFFTPNIEFVTNFLWKTKQSNIFISTTTFRFVVDMTWDMTWDSKLFWKRLKYYKFFIAIPSLD